MAKTKIKTLCPCSDHEFKLEFESDYEISDIYCPFCGILMDDQQDPEDDED